MPRTWSSSGSARFPRPRWPSRPACGPATASSPTRSCARRTRTSTRPATSPTRTTRCSAASAASTGTTRSTRPRRPPARCSAATRPTTASRTSSPTSTTSAWSTSVMSGPAATTGSPSRATPPRPSAPTGSATASSSPRCTRTTGTPRTRSGRASGPRARTRRPASAPAPPRAWVAVPRLGYRLIMDKVVASAADAVADIPEGATLAVGGFGLCGIPSVLIQAVLEAGTKDLQVVSNNAGVDDWGLGLLLGAKRLRRIVASYVGENKEFARQYLAGELEVELTPQGTLAERMRAGGSGIAAFFTRTGVGTQVADGGMPWKYDSDGNIALASPPKPTQEFDGLEYVLERAIVADFGLVRAWKGDRHGNLVFRDAARNFNPLAAMCGKVTIAEVEHLVDPGDINPNDVHTPGVFVQRVIPLTEGQAKDKRIEKRTVRG